MVQSAVLERPHDRSLGKGAQTRERILDAAEAAVLAKGFAATSIDELLFEAAITKSGFFYHFRDKNDLGRGLLERFQVRDAAQFEALFARADELSDDPLHSYLIAMKLLAEMLADLQKTHPGCLVVTFIYQDQQFDAGVRALWVEIALTWRARFRERLDRIAAVYPPRVDIDLDTLADMVGANIDGGIILSKSLKDTQLLVDQLMAYRTFVRLVFTGT